MQCFSSNFDSSEWLSILLIITSDWWALLSSSSVRPTSPFVTNFAKCTILLLDVKRQQSRNDTINRGSVRSWAIEYISPNTDPTPTDVSWFLSPKRIRRVFGPILSSRSVINFKSTIEASSTTTRSYGITRLNLFDDRQNLLPQSKSLWTVDEWKTSWSVVNLNVCDSWATTSNNRVAALPVGADRTIWSKETTCISNNIARTRTIVVVFPVPGPPLTTTKGRRTTNCANASCSSVIIQLGNIDVSTWPNLSASHSKSGKFILW